MTTVDHQRHVGDVLRPIQVTFLDDTGVPVKLRDDLGQPPVINLKIRRAGMDPWQDPPKAAVVVEVMGQPETHGQVEYTPYSGDFDVASVYETLFHFTWQTGQPEHLPHEGFFLVEVLPT